MAQPSNTTVTIDGSKFNALSAHIGVSTLHSHSGMPRMGTLQWAIAIVVDMHDNANMPYATLQKIFDLAHGVTVEKIKDIKVELWQDENQQETLCTYTFKGWISEFSTGSGGGANHTLSIRVQPALDQHKFFNLKMGN